MLKSWLKWREREREGGGGYGVSNRNEIYKSEGMKKKKSEKSNNELEDASLINNY